MAEDFFQVVEATAKQDNRKKEREKIIMCVKPLSSVLPSSALVVVL